MSEVVATRGAALALQEDKRFLEAGLEFLEEKRMLLAAALLEEMAAWRIAKKAYDAAMAEAVAALKAAVARHGFESVALHPAPEGTGKGLATRERNFLGLRLLVEPAEAPCWSLAPVPAAVDSSPRIEQCRAAFAALPPLALALAVRVGNIRRLIGEYRATERKARALENVILPETVADLAAITGYLDEIDQEEAVHIRNATR